MNTESLFSITLGLEAPLGSEGYLFFIRPLQMKNLCQIEHTRHCKILNSKIYAVFTSYYPLIINN